MEVSENLLKRLFKYVFVYEDTKTLDDWGFDENTDEFVKKQKVERTYYIDYTETYEEISLEEYEEFLRLEKTLKVR